MTEPRAVVDAVLREIELSRGSHVWNGFVNALKLVSQVVFTKSSRFFLELVQNADDAGLGQPPGGFMRVYVNANRIKVVHNGKPFDQADVRAVCNISSSKKPERGTLGYLGIGFKSVFKVTDAPEIYSGGFRFRFDRNSWPDAANTPWQVMPLWIETPSEPIDDALTTIVLPFREAVDRIALLRELEALETDLYLFLRWLVRIEVTNEDSGVSWFAENLGESANGVSTLRSSKGVQRFRFFRRTLSDLPPKVRDDRLTQEYRANVTKREIAIAFSIDKDGHLSPRSAGAMFGGVYSFLPLGEAKSGAKFPIQADFLVQPGRDAINPEALWNVWLIKEIEKLCEEAIEVFRAHEVWRYELLPMFEFGRVAGSEPFELLFEPELIQPLEAYLARTDCVPTTDGQLARPESVIRLDEGADAVSDLVSSGILSGQEIGPLLGGGQEMRIADPRVLEPIQKPFKRATRMDLLTREDFLATKAADPDAPLWFRSLYLWLQRHPRWTKQGKKSVLEGYHQPPVVLTAERKLLTGGKVSLVDLPPEDSVVTALAQTLQSSKQVVHPEMFVGIDANTRETLRGFLTGLAGVQLLDGETVCREVLLPRILTSSPKPDPARLLSDTKDCHRILGAKLGGVVELWVLAKSGGIFRSREAFISKEFQPDPEWESNSACLPGLNFLSSEYLKSETNPEVIRSWRRFFEQGGVRASPDNATEEFAINYAKRHLPEYFRAILGWTTPPEQARIVDKRNLGYDLEFSVSNGSILHVEVKGQTQESDVDLTGNETEAADIHADSFFLCVVYAVPEMPRLHVIRNPAAPGVGRKEKLSIPITVWKDSRWSP